MPTAGKQLKAVNFTAAYSSDSGRAIETAHHILKANPNNMNIISYQSLSSASSVTATSKEMILTKCGNLWVSKLR